MPEQIIQLPADSTGKKLHSFERTIGANVVQDEVVLLGEPYLASYTFTIATAASVATANSHILQIMAGASLIVRVHRIEVAQMGLATTAAMCEWTIYRLSTAGTGGSAISEQKFDPADAASGATARSLPSVKGTESGVLWASSAAMTQTVGVTPSYNYPLVVFDASLPRMKPIVIAAGTSNGIALKNLTAVAAATVVVTAFITEANF